MIASVGQQSFELRAHYLLRRAAAGAITLMLLRRAIYLGIPGLLPYPGWHPISELHRWTAAIVTGMFELALQLILLGAPFGCWLAFRTRSGTGWKRSMIGTLSALILMYAVAYFLLAPPR